MKNLLPGTLLCLLALTACTDRTERSLNKDAATNTPTPSAMPAPAASSGEALPQGATTPAPAPATSGTVALNPEHGQPGHRCEIPVGAPLNGGAQQAPAAVNVQPQDMPTGPRVQNATPAATAPTQISSQVKLNPPHGEPGHDCAVPVGQPLPAK